MSYRTLFVFPTTQTPTKSKWLRFTDFFWTWCVSIISLVVGLVLIAIGHDFAGSFAFSVSSGAFVSQVMINRAERKRQTEELIREYQESCKL